MDKLRSYKAYLSSKIYFSKNKLKTIIVLSCILLGLYFLIIYIDSDYQKLIEFKESIYLKKSESESYLDKVLRLTGCLDKLNNFRRVQRGDFWVLENYIKPDGSPPHCHETVTYTANGDFTFLDNVVPAIKRWMAPFSMAVHTPGTDYAQALDSVIYLRNCLNESELVRKYATFHFFFHRNHVPENFIENITELEERVDCSIPPPYETVTAEGTYKAKNGLLYFINVGRNVAREAATTHFIFASDIELYPNPGVVQDFLQLYARRNHTTQREVFVFPIFEVEANATVPESKTKLIQMLNDTTAVYFHYYYCKGCHIIPKYGEWLKTPETNELDIFGTFKRSVNAYWEPIYIGTIEEPLYEETLSWEGQSDKMPQAYIMCVLDYDFHVLNNAFLVHRPGIKYKSSARGKSNRDYVTKNLLPELVNLYGTRTGCYI